MSAEELKAAVRRYADEHFGGWTYAAVTVRVGDVGDRTTETLLVLPPPTSSDGASSTSREPPPAR